MPYHFDVKHWLATAPRAWFDSAWQKVVKHPSFEACNTHLTVQELATLVNSLQWPKDVQVFSPYEPTTAGYTQLFLYVLNPAAPGPVGSVDWSVEQQRTERRRPAARRGQQPRFLHVRFSLHVLAAVYLMRFLREPAMDRFSSTMMGAALRGKMQASHLLENIEMAAMGINPYFMVMEGGEVNKSRHACTMMHAKMEFLAKNSSSMGPNCEREWDRHICHQGPHKFLPKETSHTFKCNNPKLHIPECRGWDHRVRHIPVLVEHRWAAHLEALEWEKHRVQSMSPQQQVADKLRKANNMVASLKKQLKKMQDMERAASKRPRRV